MSINYLFSIEGIWTDSWFCWNVKSLTVCWQRSWQRCWKGVDKGFSPPVLCSSVGLEVNLGFYLLVCFVRSDLGSQPPETIPAPLLHHTTPTPHHDIPSPIPRTLLTTSKHHPTPPPNHRNTTPTQPNTTHYPKINLTGCVSCCAKKFNDHNRQRRQNGFYFSFIELVSSWQVAAILLCIGDICIQRGYCMNKLNA